MAKLTYFPLIIDRWIAGTRFMDIEQIGAYIQLLVYLYEHPENYLKDEAHIARILGIRLPRARRLWNDSIRGKPPLKSKFIRIKFGYYHSIVRELLKNGGKIRGLKGEAFPTDQEPDPDPEVRKEPPSYNSPPVGARFEDWWKCYPRKVGKKPCRAIWVRRKLDDKADELIADVQNRQVNDSRWLGGFVPNPATYLNQDRWQDEIQQDTQETPFERTERKLQQWVDERPDGEVLASDGQPVRPTVVPLLR